MTKTASYLMVVSCVAVLAVGQILFKSVSNRIIGPNGFTDPGTIMIFLIALALYGASTVIWVLALRNLPLSHAYPFMSLGFVIVPVAAHVVFGEALGWRQLSGAVIIAIGIIWTVS